MAFIINYEVQTMIDQNINNASLGKSLILAAVDLDEAIAELLKLEIKRIKKLTKEASFLEEVHKTHILVRYIIMALIMTDEKINTGMILCNDEDQNKN